jgi:hypothetical protein
LSAFVGRFHRLRCTREKLAEVLAEPFPGESVVAEYEDELRALASK